MKKDMCPLCDREMSPGLESWHFMCHGCGYENSTLNPRINETAAHSALDEDFRENGLQELRNKNFSETVRALLFLKPEGGKLLDVGCAYGWFLKTAKDSFECLGLEPDQDVFEACSQKGLPVKSGYFPDALGKDETFDVIVFNDVFEHIPNPENILEACRDHLNEGGVLMLTLPSNEGVFYRIAKMFCKFGYPSFFERLWQKGFPSPHLHYFNKNTLSGLLEKNGFKVRKVGFLSTLQMKGLYRRIFYDRKLSKIKGMLIYFFVMASLPLVNFMPKDIVFVVSEKK